MARKYYTLEARLVRYGEKSWLEKYLQALERPIVVGQHEVHITEGRIIKKTRTVMVDDSIRFDNYYFLYEENGKLYEFFSGLYFGTAVEPKSYTGYRLKSVIVREPWGFPIAKLCCDYGSGEYSGHELSATQFLDKVENYYKHKEIIASTVRENLSILDECIQARIAENKAKEKQKEKEEKDAASWLDSVIQSRTE